ncbi:MAG: hypothetical protein GXY05_09730, partial [Clostridiales bacterium]|nr:hypothetical protein [Clostridiales bacterium]
MKLFRITALLLCMLIASAVLTGCRQAVKSPFVSDDAVINDPVINDPVITEGAAGTPQPAMLNFEGARAAFDSKTVMMTVDGTDVTWDELYYYIYAFITYMQQNGVGITSWSADYSDGTSYEDYVLGNIITYIINNAAIDYGAVQIGASITEEDLSLIQAAWDAEAESVGGEEALITQIEAEYGTKELFLKIQEMPYLKNACFVMLYGENGNRLTDAEVADSTAEDGFYMAKHILLKTAIMDDTGSEKPMSDTEKVVVLEKAEEILNQLKTYTGSDFGTFFDELMFAKSEDKGGLAEFPQGYLYQEGDMVTAFYEAAAALEIGQLSDIVETEIGYHIIYRLPVNYDTT